jgi:hypothetical protein
MDLWKDGTASVGVLLWWLLHKKESLNSLRNILSQGYVLDIRRKRRVFHNMAATHVYDS